MTYRPSDSSSKNCYSQPQSRLNQQIRNESTDEGCPVIEESGTVCGERNNLCIFQEFRQIYDDCLKKLEGSSDGNGTLKRLAPFRNLIEDLWEQNAMLVETVEELEQEATCTVTNLQEKLNKSCQKVSEYEEDINSLIIIIRRFCENGVLDFSGLKFNTLCPSNLCGECDSSMPTTECSDFEGTSTDSFRCKSCDLANAAPSVCSPAKSKRSRCATSKNKSTSGISCKNACYRMDSIAENVCASKQNYSTKTFKIESAPTLINESFYTGSCSEDTDEDFCFNNFGENKFQDITCEQEDYKECTGAININLNIGAEPLRGNKSCDCNCQCSSNSPEDNY